jgi:hypothetical protein
MNCGRVVPKGTGVPAGDVLGWPKGKVTGLGSEIDGFLNSISKGRICDSCDRVGRQMEEALNKGILLEYSDGTSEVITNRPVKKPEKVAKFKKKFDFEE